MTEQEKTLTRVNLKTPRAAAFAGILFSVLFIISLVLLRIYVPADPWEEGAWLHQQWKTVGFALSLLPFAGIAFLWFIGVLRERIGVHEDRFFATVFLGSGLLFLALLFVVSGLGGSLIMYYGSASEKLKESGTYQFVRVLIYQLSHVYMIRMEAMFMFCTSTVIIRTAILPRWSALLGLALALLLLVSFKYFSWITLVFPIWIFLISLLVFLRKKI